MGVCFHFRANFCEIVERAHAERRLDCLFVFHREGEPIGDFRKAWSNACKAAGLGRSLRRTISGERPCATWSGPEFLIGLR